MDLTVASRNFAISGYDKNQKKVGLSSSRATGIGSVDGTKKNIYFENSLASRALRCGIGCWWRLGFRTVTDVSKEALKSGMSERVQSIENT